MKCIICEQKASICENCYTIALATASEILEERLNCIKELEAENDILKQECFDLGAEIVAIEAKVIEAIGWAHADGCIDLDEGRDPRKKLVPEMLERAKRDLNI